MLQTILFPKSRFTYHDAIIWLSKHHFHHKKVDETENMFRFRQTPPIEGARYATITLPNGVELVNQYPTYK